MSQEKMRLDKMLVHLSVATRKEAKILVKEKRITVNGMPVKSADEKISPTEDVVALDGQVLGYETKSYILLHKPQGYLTATEDKRQATVMDLLPQRYQKLHPVGRLDKDTEGLLLLTNDGALTHRLLSPKHHVEKEYVVHTEEPLTDADLLAIRQGLTLSDGTKCLPAQAFLAGRFERAGISFFQSHLILQEGKFHQVKRMFAVLEKPVQYLKRIRMGGVRLDATLEKGAFRLLTSKEIEELKGL